MAAALSQRLWLGSIVSRTNEDKVRSHMNRHLKQLFRYRGLLWTLTVGELKARHRQTVLGIVWSLVQPVTMMLVFVAVFSVFARVPLEGGTPYALFAYTGLISWLFFANSLAQGLTSIVTNMNLITKANFPREVLPLSKILVVGFDFFVGIVLLGALLVLNGVPMASAWLAVPGIVAIEVMFTAGLVLATAALYVLKRDLGSILPLLLQAWMFLSPVVYPVAVIPEQYRTLYMSNPMALILEAQREALLRGIPPAASQIVPAALTAVIVLYAGYALFKRAEARFADVM